MRQRDKLLRKLRELDSNRRLKLSVKELRKREKLPRLQRLRELDLKKRLKLNV